MHVSLSAYLISQCEFFLSDHFQPTKGNFPGQKIVPILDVIGPGSLYYQAGTISKQSWLNIKQDLNNIK